jgi:hypothetical protein
MTGAETGGNAPGNAALPSGIRKAANQEIGVPGDQVGQGVDRRWTRTVPSSISTIE